MPCAPTDSAMFCCFCRWDERMPPYERESFAAAHDVTTKCRLRCAREGARYMVLRLFSRAASACAQKGARACMQRKKRCARAPPCRHAAPPRLFRGVAAAVRYAIPWNPGILNNPGILILESWNPLEPINHKFLQKVKNAQKVCKCKIKSAREREGEAGR